MIAAPKASDLAPGERLRKTAAGIDRRMNPRSETGTFVRYTRDREILVHVDSYPISSCQSAWDRNCWKRTK